MGRVINSERVQIAFGPREVSERKTIVEAEDREGPAYESCRAAARVAMGEASAHDEPLSLMGNS
jgi:hypothetical protein